jgi:hypothetical protein
VGRLIGKNENKIKKIERKTTTPKNFLSIVY